MIVCPYELDLMSSPLYYSRKVCKPLYISEEYVSFIRACDSPNLSACIILDFENSTRKDAKQNTKKHVEMLESVMPLTYHFELSNCR